jgi:RNA polymerase-binding transcription factor DksA
VDRIGQSSESTDTSDSEPHQRITRAAGMRVGKAHGVNSRMLMPSSRVRALASAISRLEQEHVALLMALCDLEESAASGHDAQMRSVLIQVLREDLRRTQHALRQAAQGTYGICEICQQPLSRRHLSLHPSITRCWACTGRLPHDHPAQH